MMRNVAFLLCAVLLFGSCDRDAAGPDATGGDLSMAFSPEALSIAAGSEGSLSIELRNCATRFFGVSLRVACDARMISLAGAGIASGDLFGEDAVGFAVEDDSLIHLTLTRTKGQGEVSGSGTLCVLTFTGLSAGTTAVRLLPDELRFYDSTGEPVEIPGIELKAATITVR